MKIILLTTFLGGSSTTCLSPKATPFYTQIITPEVITNALIIDIIDKYLISKH